MQTDRLSTRGTFIGQTQWERQTEGRIAALRRLRLLGTPSAEGFDRLTQLASKLLRAPIALVSLVDEDRQFFKSQCGLPEPWASRRETPLSHSYCQYVVKYAEPLIVPDARHHPLLHDNLAIQDLRAIAYAGIPLVTSGAHTIGSFCVIDHQPHSWTRDEVATLSDLAALVMTEIELGSAVNLAEETLVELQHRDQRLELALRAGKLGAWELDLQTEALECTAQCKANFGRSPTATFTYQDLFEAIHPGDRATVRAEVRRAIQHSGRYEVDYRAVWPDGSIHTIVAHGVVSYADDGRPLRMAGITQDITEQVRARQELAEASRAKSEFMAVVSHELRTPLAGIMAYSELLQLGVPEEIPERAQEHVRRIDNAGRHLLVLIEEILTFSRVEAGAEAIRPARVSLSEIIAEAASFILPVADKKGITIVLDQSDPLLVFTDAGKLRQILLNLLSNAVKFTDQGYIRVTASSEGNHLRVDVRDTGTGIATEHLNKVFDPFWQVNQTASRTAGGMGLGLAVSRQIAGVLGGDLTVESTPGEGSVFTLILPVGGDDLPEVMERGCAGS